MEVLHSDEHRSRIEEEEGNHRGTGDLQGSSGDSDSRLQILKKRRQTRFLFQGGPGVRTR